VIQNKCKTKWCWGERGRERILRAFLATKTQPTVKYSTAQNKRRERANMSGGSYEYISYSLASQCRGRMYDAEMEDLINDICEVLHALEWWQSGDYGEESYRKELTKFKTKWFKEDRTERLKKYIDEQIGTTRSQLYSLIGEMVEGKE